MTARPLPTPESVVPEEDAVFVVQGLRARTMVDWRDHLLGPALISGPTFLSGGSTPDQIIRWVSGVASMALILHMLVKFARGRIELFSDQLVITAWNDFFSMGTVRIRLGDLRRVAVAETRLRIAYDRFGESQALKISLNSSVAEELFDRIEECLDGDEALRERLDAQGPHRLLLAPPVEGESDAPSGGVSDRSPD